MQTRTIGLEVNVPIVPTEKTNAINVTVYYMPNTTSGRGITIGIHGVELKKGMQTYMPYDNEHSRTTLVLEPLERLSKKRLAAVALSVGQEIKNRSGANWDRIKARADEKGFQIVENPST